MQVGNIFGGTLYLALCGLVDTAEIAESRRVGMYSYGSGCASEFFSGIVHPHSQIKQRMFQVGQALANRYHLNMQEYDRLLHLNAEWLFGIKNKTLDYSQFANIYERQFVGKGLLTLKAIGDNYHRKYEWS
jgi:polyketide biosynthesis 3-hydroxy-3-methylglutaryl-CoA synthase-like enzyme PksG